MNFKISYLLFSFPIITMTAEIKKELECSEIKQQ